MKRRRIAIVGFGKLGRACAQAVLHDDELNCAGIVRRPEHVMERLPAGLEHLSVVAHVGELQAVDAALICVPAEHVAGAARELMQRKLPAALWGEARRLAERNWV